MKPTSITTLQLTLPISPPLPKIGSLVYNNYFFTTKALRHKGE
jgi:hypothetical protein